MKYIRWFHEIGAAEVDLVGGKGANLGEVTRAGFPVPPGFCVTAPAYRELIEVTGLYPIIQNILDKTDLRDPAFVAASASQIRELITQQPIPVQMANEILDGYRDLGHEMNLADPASLPVAIRSSATAEDLPTASFAGQQDTYLNVRGEQALLEHVRRCWASLWTDRAIRYRVEQGFDHQKVYVSVVVQAMVQSEVSGILFTANPVTGNREELVINASWGLGEAVVSGLVSPDTLTVNKKGGDILSRHTASKEKLIAYAADGGIIELDTPEEQRTAMALTDQQAAELTKLGLKIEKHYGVPQDIEWGLANGKWYLLQARPITTLAPAEEFIDVEGEYSRIMLVEIFPDALSPIFLSVVAPLLQGMFDFTFNALGLKPVQDLDAVGTFYNQPYFHRQYIEQTLNALSPSVRESMVEQFINPISHEKQPSARELSPAYLGIMARMLRFMVRFPNQLPEILAHYQAEVAKIAAYPLFGATDEELVANTRYLVFDVVSSLLNYDFLLIASTGRAYRILEVMLQQTYGDQTEEVVAKLISGLNGNVTMETNKRLWDLAQLAKTSIVVSDILRSYDPDEAMDRLQETPEGRDFLKELEEFLREFGHREIRLDIIYPTWGEDPAPVFGFLSSYLDSDESQSPYWQQKRLRQERRELTGEVMTNIKRGLKGRTVLAPLFRWMLAQAQTHTRERDTMHFEWTRLFPPLRRLLLELGHRWCKQGYIERQDDIFYLHFEDLEEMVRSPRSFTKEVQSRKEAFELNRSRPWPDIIRDGRAIYAKKTDPAIVEGEGLLGVAGSPGQVTGISKVIRGPEEFGKLQKGDILVAPLTNPVWTPLFAVAGGIITEVGGILSHGAIVAREYGIPAVMSVTGATTLIPEGQTITVDGDKGIVYFEETTRASPIT